MKRLNEPLIPTAIERVQEAMVSLNMGASTDQIEMRLELVLIDLMGDEAFAEWKEIEITPLKLRSATRLPSHFMK